jgi:hypothetical protein
VRAALLTIALFLLAAGPAAADTIDAGPTDPVSALEGTQWSGSASTST